MRAKEFIGEFADVSNTIRNLIKPPGGKPNTSLQTGTVGPKSPSDPQEPGQYQSGTTTPQNGVGTLPTTTDMAKGAKQGSDSKGSDQAADTIQKLTRLQGQTIPTSTGPLKVDKIQQTGQGTKATFQHPEIGNVPFDVNLTQLLKQMQQTGQQNK